MRKFFEVEFKDGVLSESVLQSSLEYNLKCVGDNQISVKEISIDICAKCKGSGEVWNQDRFNVDDDKWIKCSLCEGTGISDNKIIRYYKVEFENIETVKYFAENVEKHIPGITVEEIIKD